MWYKHEILQQYFERGINFVKSTSQAKWKPAILKMAAILKMVLKVFFSHGN